MALKSFALTFDGYWREPNIAGIPKQSGVYCVYACTYDEQGNTVSIRLLVYIGEADDVSSRVANHEKRPRWRKHLRAEEQLCFSFAPHPAADRDRVEAAFIFHHKPPDNDEYIDTFPFDTTTVTTAGRNARLAASFTVRRTP